MRLLLKMGWRNIFRNTKRTILTSLVIGLGLAAIILQDAFMIGMIETLTEKATGTLLGHGQIHHKDFLETSEVENTVQDLDMLLPLLDKKEEIEAYSLRAVTPGMLSSPRNLAPITLYGIEPKKERHLSRIHRAILEGSFFHDEKNQTILIGDEAADLLEVAVGDRLVLTLAQAHSGDLSQDLLTVGGIFHLGERYLDRGIGFVSLPKEQTMLDIGKGVHEVAIKFKDLNIASDPLFSFWDEASISGNEAQSWRELAPALRALLDFSEFAIYIIFVILFSLVILIIMNSLFMSIYERMREFGTLHAIGTSPSRLFLLILIESGYLGVLSCVIGSVIAGIVLAVLGVTGIDYSGIDVGRVTINEAIFPIATWKHFTTYPLAVFFCTIAAAIIPAFSAARTSPVKAMQPKG